LAAPCHVTKSMRHTNDTSPAHHNTLCGLCLSSCRVQGAPQPKRLPPHIPEECSRRVGPWVSPFGPWGTQVRSSTCPSHTGPEASSASLAIYSTGLCQLSCPRGRPDPWGPASFSCRVLQEGGTLLRCALGVWVRSSFCLSYFGLPPTHPFPPPLPLPFNDPLSLQGPALPLYTPPLPPSLPPFPLPLPLSLGVPWKARSRGKRVAGVCACTEAASLRPPQILPLSLC